MLHKTLIASFLFAITFAGSPTIYASDPLERETATEGQESFNALDSAMNTAGNLANTAGKFFTTLLSSSNSEAPKTPPSPARTENKKAEVVTPTDDSQKDVDADSNLPPSTPSATLPEEKIQIDEKRLANDNDSERITPKESNTGELNDHKTEVPADDKEKGDQAQTPFTQTEAPSTETVAPSTKDTSDNNNTPSPSSFPRSSVTEEEKKSLPEVIIQDDSQAHGPGISLTKQQPEGSEQTENQKKDQGAANTEELNLDKQNEKNEEKEKIAIVLKEIIETDSSPLSPRSPISTPADQGLDDRKGKEEETKQKNESVDQEDQQLEEDKPKVDGSVQSYNDVGRIPILQVISPNSDSAPSPRSDNEQKNDTPSPTQVDDSAALDPEAQKQPRNFNDYIERYGYDSSLLPKKSTRKDDDFINLKTQPPIAPKHERRSSLDFNTNSSNGMALDQAKNAMEYLTNEKKIIEALGNYTVCINLVNSLTLNEEDKEKFVISGQQCKKIVLDYYAQHKLDAKAINILEKRGKDLLYKDALKKENPWQSIRIEEIDLKTEHIGYPSSASSSSSSSTSTPSSTNSSSSSSSTSSDNTDTDSEPIPQFLTPNIQIQQQDHVEIVVEETESNERIKASSLSKDAGQKTKSLDDLFTDDGEIFFKDMLTSSAIDTISPESPSPASSSSSSVEKPKTPSLTTPTGSISHSSTSSIPVGSKPKAPTAKWSYTHPHPITTKNSGADQKKPQAPLSMQSKATSSGSKAKVDPQKPSPKPSAKPTPQVTTSIKGKMPSPLSTSSSADDRSNLGKKPDSTSSSSSSSPSSTTSSPSPNPDVANSNQSPGGVSVNPPETPSSKPTSQIITEQQTADQENKTDGPASPLPRPTVKSEAEKLHDEIVAISNNLSKKELSDLVATLKTDNNKPITNEHLKAITDVFEADGHSESVQKLATMIRNLLNDAQLKTMEINTSNKNLQAAALSEAKSSRGSIRKTIISVLGQSAVAVALFSLGVFADPIWKAGTKMYKAYKDNAVGDDTGDDQTGGGDAICIEQPNQDAPVSQQDVGQVKPVSANQAL